MHGYYNTSCSNNYSTTNDLSYHLSGDFFEHSPVLDNLTLPVPALPVDCLKIPNNELDSVSETLRLKQELCNFATSSGCSSYGSPTSLTNHEAAQPWSYMMQKSLSIHSLHNNMHAFDHYHQQLSHFFSTGDLERKNMVQQQHRSESPLSNESSIIECMNAKACKYSPEEKREKIEKYRSKRNQRNFNKKIKRVSNEQRLKLVNFIARTVNEYVCRKTLADSRPRIRGRFAKNNDENEKGVQLIDEWNHIAAYYHGGLQEDNENWISFVDAFSANAIP